MEGHGLIARRQSSTESRVQELYVTKKGAELAAQIRPIVTEQSKDFFKFISGRRTSSNSRTFSALGLSAYRGPAMNAGARRSRVALLSGASRGIGAATARELGIPRLAPVARHARPPDAGMGGPRLGAHPLLRRERWRFGGRVGGGGGQPLRPDRCHRRQCRCISTKTVIEAEDAELDRCSRSTERRHAGW